MRRHEQTFLQRRHTNCLQTRKNVLHLSASGKYKSKPQWDTTSHQWERGKLTRQEATNFGEDVEKREPWYTVGGNVKWCSHSGKLWMFLKELKTDLPNDPAIALLGIYLKDTDAMKCREGHLHPDVSSSNVHNSQTVEGASVSIERWTDKKRCGLCIQWNITQPLEMTNLHHLLRHGWNWRILC